MANQKIITIPHLFTPRIYQQRFYSAMDNGILRAVLIYHRRAGKDKSCWNFCIKEAVKRRGVYYYLFPEFAQGKRVIWDGMDKGGFKFRDHIPVELLVKENSTDMLIELANGSIIQIIGTDKFDKVRGSNPIGCVFSEYAFQNPTAWNVIRPILAENGGWAVFNSSTNGKNHFYEMHNMALTNPKWFLQNLTAYDTLDVDGSRFCTDEMIQDERDAGMPEEMIQQEYFNSFTSNSKAFYYLQYMEQAEQEGRIGDVPWNPAYPVDTWWDIGVSDENVIIFTQAIDRYIHIIDVVKGSNRALDFWAKELQLKPYVYSSHTFPHDMDHVEYGSGRTRIELAQELFTNVELNVLSKLPKQEGINALRVLFPQIRIDKEKCETLIKALYNYRREYNDKLQEYSANPVHDWASHYADAARYMATGIIIPSDDNSIVARRTRGNRPARRRIKDWRIA
jgi:hypothetical protein